ncbi:MAG TPA: O-methyltransferase [Edaphocola sp.]|nr:O-methyltransferase [Edaphocola sp.]
MENSWIIKNEVHQYVSAYTEKEDDVLQQLNEDTQAHVHGAHMLSGAFQGSLLTLLSQMIKPKNILELGTYTGYSAICLAKGLQLGGKLHTIDIDTKLEEIRKKYWKAAQMQDCIIQHIGPALEIIPSLNEPFDLVFLDADKGNYIAYFELLIEKLPLGAVIIADNVLFHGEVLKASSEQGKAAKHIQKFNDHVLNSKRVHTVMLPIRDGISIIRKIK